MSGPDASAGAVRRATGDDLASLLPLVAEDDGASRLFLETEDSNRAARRFYSHAGFEVEDSVWMQRPL